MSQTLWTRKTREPNVNVEENSTTIPSTTSSSSSFAGADSPYHRVAVPPNEKGKRYTMNEVFQVWYDNKDSILNKHTTQKPSENYKLAQPSPIYHLELQSQSSFQKKIGGDVNGEEFEQRDVNQAGEVPSTYDNSGIAVGSLERLSINEQSVPIHPNQQSQGPPPGMISATQSQADPKKHVSFVTPDKIEWIYVDPSGKEQGPFNGEMMQEWLTDGYLHLDLRIRRKEEYTFQTLKDLCETVQNYTHPFKVPLLDLSTPPPPVPPQQQQQQQQQQQPANDNVPLQSQIHQFLSGGNDSSLNLGAASMRLNSNINQQNLFGNDFMTHGDPFVSQNSTGGFQNGPTTSNSFGIDTLNFNHQSLPMNTHMPSILQQQIQQQQQPVLSRSNSGWGLDNGGLMGSSPATPVGPVPSVLQNSINQPSPVSPWLSGVPHSRVSSPFIPATSLADTTSGKKDDNSILNITREDAVALDNSNGPNKSIKEDLTDEIQNKETNKLKEDIVKKEEEHNVEQNTAEQAAELASATETTSISTSNSTASNVIAAAAATAALLSSEVPASPATTKSTLAPWATKEAEANVKPKLTLKEIQQIEAEELKKQKKLQHELNEQASRAASQAWQEEQAAASTAPALPKGSGWGSSTSVSAIPAATKKTLADIQREEAEAAALRASASKTVSSPMISSKPLSFASAVANSTPKDDASWTVVPKKATVVKKSAKPMSPIVNNATSKVDPQMLRSVSASRPITSINSTVLREEFVVWARSSMTNLYPSVSKDDLLDIFLTLPSNSSESSSLISETIYSSSPTMDGRRFAKEFLDKRAKVEQQVGNSSSSWSSAIISSADKVQTVDEEGWSTGKKKKGRR
ncbi:hypothetical protein CLIB1423_11S00694 [[Candida] railenensis]|uniref:GYF domain-containing protein n=1 Tax=[Candida] railenensis TaxID=45579 RepID=A0A9P0QRB0_9ASCO|nr:hypothetical protein CLIB1423_11S00694 [[Candida] railenensis]